MSGRKKILGLLEYQRRAFWFLFFLAFVIAISVSVFSVQVVLEEVRRDSRRVSGFLREEIQTLLISRKTALDRLSNVGGFRKGEGDFFLQFFSFLGKTSRSCRVEQVFAGPNLKGVVLPPKSLDGKWHLSPLLSPMGSLSLLVASPREGGYVVGSLLVPKIFSSRGEEEYRGFWGLVISDGGEVFSSRNDRGLFPAGSVVPRSFLDSFRRYGKFRIAGWSVEILTRNLAPGLLYVTGIWMDQVYRKSLLLGIGSGSIFLGAVLVILLFARRLFRRTYEDFSDLAKVFGHLDSSIQEASSPLDAIAEIRYRYQRELNQDFGYFKESQALVRAFSGMMESVAGQGQELAALYEETSALQQELMYSNSELRHALERLEELALFSQTAVEARSPKEAAATLIRSMTSFSKAKAGGVVILEDRHPVVLAFEGKPEVRENLEKLLEDRALQEHAEVVSFSGEMWHAFPISYLGSLLGAVLLAEETRKTNELRKELHSVMAHFVPHVGGILRSRILVDEVHRSFHYMAVRLQMISSAYHDETGEHLARIRSYTHFVGEKLGISGDILDDLGTYSMLHDIGKLKVPLDILAKPGKLTPEEFGIVKNHAQYGAELLGDSDWLSMAREICLCHHERWDGSGYPQGLKENEIPLSARIVGLVDIYDALRSRRSYKAPFSHEKSCRIILEGDGWVDPKHFDPEILSLFREYARNSTRFSVPAPGRRNGRSFDFSAEKDCSGRWYTIFRNSLFWVTNLAPVFSALPRAWGSDRFAARVNE